MHLGRDIKYSCGRGGQFVAGWLLMTVRVHQQCCYKRLAVLRLGEMLSSNVSDPYHMSQKGWGVNAEIDWLDATALSW